jgi:hypothetical protein
LVIADTVAVKAPASRSWASVSDAPDAPDVTDASVLGMGWFRGTPVFYLSA